MLIKLDILSFYIKFLDAGGYVSDILPHMRSRLPKIYEEKDFRSWRNYLKDVYYLELENYIDSFN